MPTTIRLVLDAAGPNTIVVSLLPLKSQMAGAQGVNVIKQFLKAQPPCTIEVP